MATRFIPCVELMRVVPATPEHLDSWAEMRIALWPWDTAAIHREDAGRLYLTGNPDRVAFVITEHSERIIAFAEATIRRDYVEGCVTSPVTFLEGIYVRPEARRSGAARKLVNAVAMWGRERGCTEYASNALLDNVASHAFHAAIGFTETERVVFFKKELK